MLRVEAFVFYFGSVHSYNTSNRGKSFAHAHRVGFDSCTIGATLVD
jgi:hypothetical protein